MADLKQFGFQLPVHTGPKRRLKASLRAVGCTLVVLGMMLPCLEIATAQQEPSSLERRKADLEVQKLELEFAKLKKDRGELPGWLTGVLGVLAGIVGTATSVWLARRARLGALDQSVHDKRLESYPELVKATAGLALYFPSGDAPVPIGPKDCGTMGRAMSVWYFGGGGLLLSVKARDAYFALARAVTRASLAEKLKVPVFPRDAEDISGKKVDEYRAELVRKFNLDDVENWKFGDPGLEEKLALRSKIFLFLRWLSSSFRTKPSKELRRRRQLALRFKDFVFLQRLSSGLRTKLSNDLRSRRPPS